VLASATMSKMTPRFVVSLLVLSVMFTASIDAKPKSLPFVGVWSGVTVSADPTNFPVVSIVAEGTGQLTHLGRYFMFSPHTTDVSNGLTIGDQIFTAANGDMLTAFCEGSPQPQADATVFGSLDCEITGGTGRFADASGDYVFVLHARPRTDGGPGYATNALIVGRISY
jgi:hypothetical protein